ncbi:QWRF motif-containing protein 7 [Mercurialis annua]|uniref:QWRF motif-containing protein 7 n=1 Tax=Mercurialis annua TaxID=3986 RepID=UPI00215F2434|nr:QWRF motif-containing protein 7 [Mercurialis annua]
MESPLTRRNPPTPIPSPRLARSRSGSENNSITINSSQKFNSERYTSRAKSTTRSSRNTQNEENTKKPSSKLLQKKSTNNNDDDNRSSSGKDGFVRFLQRENPRNSHAATTNKMIVKAASKSPSAWALSPGRSTLFNVLPSPELLPFTIGGEEKKKKVKSGGGAVSGVLKYFKQKKLCSVQEKEYLKFRVLHNRLLQWRFANAKADATMAYMKKIAEERLFHVWLRILNLRNMLLEKRTQMVKLKNEVKLYQIINPQMNLLTEWPKIEKKNCEAVSRVTRKLSAFSVKLPLVEEAKGDVESIHKAMNTALEVMNGIEATITKFFFQVEKILYLLTELTTKLEHQKERLGEMAEIVLLVSKLLAWERSVRVQLIQVVEEPRSKEGLNKMQYHIQAN